MKRFAACLLLLVVGALPVRAHFIWIVPNETNSDKIQVVFSDSLEPDERVSIEKIAGTKLMSRDRKGKEVSVDWKKDQHAYLAAVPKDAAVLGGVCIYGVSQRGEGKPFLLAYYPKMIVGKVDADKPWDKLPLDIVPQGGKKFQLLFAGKPVPDSEVSVLAPSSKDTIRTDAKGEFEYAEVKPGLYGFRARQIEKKAGEQDGKKYEEIRHYATIVFRVDDDRKSRTELPALKEAISSFGAAAADGYVYVYGGHTGKTHQYSTETISGKFRRLSLAKPDKGWEDLAEGPGAQGLALVTHAGKIYRIGGMQPRNKPEEKSDNHSLASCAVFDTKVGKWEALPDLPAGRSSHDAAVVGDKIIVVGGWCLKGKEEKPVWHDTALILNLAKNPLQWESVEQPFKRRALNLAAGKDKVYVVCGMLPNGELELTVDIFDPATKKWSSVADIPMPIGNGFTPAACMGDGKLLVSPRDGNIYRLTDKGDGWLNVGKVDTPRFVHRMVPVGDGKVVVLGGATKKGMVSLVETIELDCCGKPVAVKVEVKPGQQMFCPVMRGVPVGDDVKEIDYQGVKVKLCCATCVKRWKAEPEAYADVEILPQLKGKDLPKRAIEQVYCPVYRDRVVCSKDPTIEHDGVKIYFFNETAKRRFQADPNKYLDAKLLPPLQATK